jgi:hypothetical protein
LRSMAERLSLTLTIEDGHGIDVAQAVANEAANFQHVQKVEAELSEEFDCPNCGQRHGPVDECLLAVAVSVYRDRTGELPPVSVVEAISADWFWQKWGGPMVDELEALVQDAKEKQP